MAGPTTAYAWSSLFLLGSRDRPGGNMILGYLGSRFLELMVYLLPVALVPGEKVRCENCFWRTQEKVRS